MTQPSSAVPRVSCQILDRAAGEGLTQEQMMKAISERPTDEMYKSGMEIDCQCARCGSSVDSERCDQCEDGFRGHNCGEDCCVCLHPEENVPCDYCRGTGVWHRCMSSPEWCQANPLPGRENVERGRIEWFTVGNQPETADDLLRECHRVLKKAERFTMETRATQKLVVGMLQSDLNRTLQKIEALLGKESD